MQIARREELPARRMAHNFKVRSVTGQEFACRVGCYQDGRPGEVFASGVKEGSGMQSLLHDASIIISLALQHGVPLQALLDGVQTDKAGQHLSPIGEILAAAQEVTKVPEAAE